VNCPSSFRFCFNLPGPNNLGASDFGSGGGGTIGALGIPEGGVNGGGRVIIGGASPKPFLASSVFHLCQPSPGISSNSASLISGSSDDVSGLVFSFSVFFFGSFFSLSIFSFG
jgi:hypothetical protein